ncbi:hypothetical protein DAPPUDRAFT_262090 [Daphnia pulex]|uniref:Chloride channel CLIC-like protein 1 n=1 Tax=Daphnia pulex TaxID=6669 RepID=E9HMB7_DAPPU|nr:hypothetical protein DAPPUDRAFT_262090 [Daphnia pulex]|eukprot:EFX67114.1 hypothetical protein DAPPUDRAFT_262090 [Daphnia pulex]
MTDPSYEVNPFVALIDMLVVGVFQPLEYIGTKIGSFFDGLLTSTGWLYKIPVLVVVLLIILMILLMCFNYEIRLPFVKLAPSAPLPSRPTEATKSVQQSITGSQNVQQVPSLAPEHHRIVSHPALNVAMGDTRHQYVYQSYEEQSVIIKRTYSQVQPVEQREQESVEDFPEDSTIPLKTIEELAGNTLPILKANDVNNRKLPQADELVSADSAEGPEKISEDSTSTEETCKGIDP